MKSLMNHNLRRIRQNIREFGLRLVGRQRQVIVCAGMSRSGSTWLYNVVRLLINVDSEGVQGYWYGDFKPFKFLLKTSKNKVLVIKTHGYDETLANISNKIFYSYRDVRDAIASRRRLTRGRVPFGRLIEEQKRHFRNAQPYWEANADYIMRYESMVNSPEQVVREIAATLRIEVADYKVILEEADALDYFSSEANNGLHNLDNLFHKNHITNGKPGSWKTTTPDAWAKKIEIEFNSWLKERNYMSSKLDFELQNQYVWKSSEFFLKSDEHRHYLVDGNGQSAVELNDTAALIYDWCAGVKKVDALIVELCEEFSNTSQSDMAGDVCQVIDQLVALNILLIDNQKNLPDFIIIGAQKSGTLSLMTHFSKHPEVKMTDDEVHFFDNQLNWEKGIDWYCEHFKNPNGRLNAEKTPEYLCNITAQKRLHSIVPDAKLVVLLRNPVTRAYSQWNHYNQIPDVSKKWGWTVTHFEEALEVNRGLLARGNYAYQLKKLFELYDRDQVYIGVTERYRSNAIGEFKKLCLFLDIGPGELKYVDRHVRKYSSTINPETQKMLQDYFKPKNEELFELLGYRITEWDDI